ncbi:MAG TPA: sigma-70 family RNA polymerase sigma factor [Chryseolinea sp.]
MEQEHERDIWGDFKKGDWHAYTLLYDTYYKRLNNYGYKFTRDVALIEDAIQDLFVKLWTNRETLGEPSSVKNYLYKALRHALFRKIKSQRKFTLAPTESYDYTFELSWHDHLVVDEDERELQRIIKEVTGKLPARQQEIVYMRFYEGLSYEEIAEIMSININSVYKLWYKTVDNLKDALRHLLSVLLVFCVSRTGSEG